MKLWEKGISTEKLIEEFTVGNDRELDIHLAKYDLQASIAHAQMLEKVALLSSDECTQIVNCLNEMLVEVQEGSFSIEVNFEDVHSKIEYELIQRIGEPGKKIHTARSRNDQVLVAMHLYMRQELSLIQEGVLEFFETLLELSEKYAKHYMPGYTHMQVAMPSSFGLWFSAYAELLIDDVFMLKAAKEVCDQNPLGSAAGYGSNFDIDRVFTTQALNFSTLKYNSVAAQLSRGKAEKSCALALASFASTLAKFAMDICLFAGQDYNFIKFPDALTTGSSIMPHKKNPDVFELIRAHCNKIQAIPQQIAGITSNLPSGYHRDLQLVKEPIVQGINQFKECLEIFNYAIKQIEVRSSILEASKYEYIWSVDTLNDWVSSGIPFREAYQNMAKSIAAQQYEPVKYSAHTHLGSIGNLCLDEIRLKMRRAAEK